MGCFGYICKHCGTSIRGNCFTGGENCVMIHVRSGEEIGRVEGHYDEYGRVIEQDGMDENTKFRGDGIGPNSHEEICKSEFRLEDSYDKVSELKLYNGKPIDFEKFCKEILINDLKSVDYDIFSLPYYSLVKKADEITLSEYDETYKQYKNLEGSKDSLLEKYHLEFLSRLIIETTLFNILRSNNVFSNSFNALPSVELDKYSGIVVYHKKCFNKALKDNSFNLTPSKYDPNQSWGNVRKKYI